jgi:hypothetical protein
MGKAYLLAIFLLAASFSGCSDSGDDPKESDSENMPIATIVSISPNPVNTTTLEKNGVAFVGFGSSGNGYIREYDWGSSIDGFLSFEKEFTTKSLSEGNHTIFFKVLNDENVWSDKATATLQVLNQTEDPGEETRTYENIYVMSVEGDFAPDPDQIQGEQIEAILNMTADPFQFQQALHNTSWVKYEHRFTIESEWEARYVLLLLTVDYHLSENATEPGEGPAGTLNFSIKDPNGGEHAEGYEMVFWNGPINERPYLLPPINGTWTIVISGSGLDGMGSLVYSGDYSIMVESERLV